jgi:hypothetical protein
MVEVMRPNQAKSAALEWLLPQAVAQERDFFPQSPSAETGYGTQPLTTALTNQALQAPAVVAAGVTAKALGLWEFSPGVIWWLPSEAILIMSSSYAIYWGVNKAHAELAPSCKEQVKELKQIMNAGHIGIAGINCKTIFNSQKSIEFLTPDGKNLPLHVDWTESSVSIGDESYGFNFSKLAKVHRVSKSPHTLVPGDKEFEDYVKNLEPYRQVIHVMGLYNSCYKCEGEFDQYLVTSKPGAYSLDSIPKSNGVDSSK